MAQRAGPFLKSPEEGGRTIGSVDELIEAVLEWWAYDRMEQSPFPSDEPPPEAARKWFEVRLGLTVKGPNLFEWSCPGCRERIEVETNYLHTCYMFDYEYWQFCPTCSKALNGAEDE